MALNLTIIAGSPTTTKADTKTVAIAISFAVPPNPEVKNVNGLATLVEHQPEREGQMLVYRNGSESSATMYIVVEIDSVLTWKEVQNWGLVIDPRTGLKKDPNLEFYSTLAY